MVLRTGVADTFVDFHNALLEGAKEEIECRILMLLRRIQESYPWSQLFSLGGCFLSIRRRSVPARPAFSGVTSASLNEAFATTDRGGWDFPSCFQQSLQPGDFVFLFTSPLACELVSGESGGGKCQRNCQRNARLSMPE